MTDEELRVRAIQELEFYKKDDTFMLADITVDLAIKALEQEPILDKIRAEIEQLTSRYSISKERGSMGQVEWSDRLIKESDALQIIDHYKAESEADT